MLSYSLYKSEGHRTKALLRHSLKVTTGVHCNSICWLVNSWTAEIKVELALSCRNPNSPQATVGIRYRVVGGG
jgi:hypothetical protein